MKKRFSSLSATHEEVQMELTPMLDVVFIMLIFFIVSTSFVKESGIEVNRPHAASAQKQERASIFIAIDEKGFVWLQKRKIELDAVRANIEKLHAESPEGALVIQADKKSETGVLIKVMDQVRLAGVKNISIATGNKKGE